MDYENIKGFLDLTKEEQEIIKVVRKAQQNGVGNDYKHLYDMYNIKEVKRSSRSEEFRTLVVEVYYNHDWFHYRIEGDIPYWF